MSNSFNIFLEELDSLIQESEHTLNEIEKVIFTQRYRLSEKHFAIFSVQTIVMMYSIWEGFVQKTFSKYLSVLNTLNIPFADYQDSLIVFHMESKFPQFREYPGKDTRKIKFYSDLRAHHELSYIPLVTSINTESDVGFCVLNRIMRQFSLDEFPEYWGSYQHPNSLKDLMTSFLRYRNGVAHGGDISSEEKVSQEIFNRYKQLVIDLMNGVSDKIKDGIENEHYLKK